MSDSIRRVTRLLRCLLIVLLVASANSLHAADPPLLDIVHLRSGGEIRGHVQEIEENKQKMYLVETDDGGVIKLRFNQVRRVERPSPELREYLQRKSAVENTVDGHWAMQQWCQENHLHKQREYHLMQIIELDPDHADARARLNYVDEGGVWVHRDHFLQNHGYIEVSKGVWRLPEAVRMSEDADANDDLSKEWTRKLKGWLQKVKRRNDLAARNNIEQVNHPAAVPGLVELIKKEDDIRIQRMLLDSLGRIPSSGAQNALVVFAMSANDRGRGLQDQCITLLKQDHYSPRGITSTVLPFLRPTPDTPNRQVNTAAWLIGHMRDQSAVRPLIDALNTTHKEPTGLPQGNFQLQQGDQGRGMQMGGQPQFVVRNYTNQSVLDTLKLLTETVDFGFNEQAWLDWYIQEQSLGTNQLGRDR
ncbi:MAG: HEAT repeat domain-containing protein [Pirellulaceae bacterium]